MTLPIVQGPNTGLQIMNDDIKAIAHKALSAGDVVVISPVVLSHGSGDATAGSTLTTTRQATGVDVNMGFAAVALNDVASGATGVFRVRGTVKARILATVTSGQRMAVKATSECLTQVTTNDKCVAVMLDSASASGTAYVLFNGIEGFGVAAG